MGARAGKRFFVMYGASEATSRMGCLPPAIALDNPAKLASPFPAAPLRLKMQQGTLSMSPTWSGS
jgi:hypothetical protein